MPSQSPDPSVEWADLLHELVGVRREAVVAALRHSASSGWPASRGSVSSLVAYAQGRIGAKEYAEQTLISLGLADAQTSVALMSHAAQASVASYRPPPPGVVTSSVSDLNSRYAEPSAAPPAVSAQPITRDNAVQAYVSGAIPLDDFLRAARGEAV